MKKFLVSQAAEILGITKEAVYNRIRRNSLRCEEIDGLKYVVFDDENLTQNEKQLSSKRSNLAKQNDDFTNFLLSLIKELKEENKKLLEDKDKLVKEKEQILIIKTNEIISLSKNNDEKLRQILGHVAKKQLENTKQIKSKVGDEEVLNAEILSSDEWLNFDEFVTNFKIPTKKVKKFQKYLLKCVAKGKTKFAKKEDENLLVRADLDFATIKGKL